MSAAQKIEYKQIDPQDELAERREFGPQGRKDRRVIPRLGHPELRKYMRMSANLCNFTAVCAVLYVGALVAAHVHGTKLELNRSIFFGVVVTVVASGIYYLGSALSSYCENESQQRLIRVSERLFRALLLFVVTGLVLGIANVISWF